MADNLTGAARAALGQGLGMGWGDEAEAWLRSRMGQGSYEDQLKKIRGEYAQYAARNPFTSGALEFAGGALPGVAAMLVPGGQPAGAAQLTRSTAGALARLGAMGAATGAVSGAGSAEEGDRLSGAGTGTLIGGVLGVATPAVMRTVKGGLNWTRERLFPTEGAAKERATRLLGEAVQQRTGMTPQQMEAAMAADRAMGVPSMVANVSPATARLARGAAKVGGPGTERLEEQLGRQKLGARERAYQQTVRGLKPKDFYAEEEQLVSDLRNKARGMYDAAYAVGEVSDPKIMRIVDTPEMKSAWDTARKIADAEASLAKIRGEDPSQFKLREVYEFITAPDGSVVGLRTKEVPDVRTLDYMKRALDAQIKTGYASENAATRANIGVLKDIRNELRDTLKTTVPEYGTALKGYAGDMEVIDSLRRGFNDFNKLDHEQVIKMVAGMTPSEKEAFRTGVARNLYSKVMDPSGNFNAAQRLIGSPELQAKMQPLFDSPAEFKLFKAALERESQLYTQASRILGGSDTAENQQLIAAIQGSGSSLGEAIESTVTGGARGGLSSLVLGAISKAQMTEKTAEQLARMLTARDPAEVAAVVQALEKMNAAAVPRAVRASAAEAGAVTGTTAALPPAPLPEGPERRLERDVGKEENLPLSRSLEEDVAAEDRQRAGQR
jgi:hypothetical protein